MIGIIDVGGGNRGVFGAGVLDYCLDNHIDIDYCIGISAGAANIVSYISGQRGRNYRFYTDYNLDIRSISVINTVKSGSYIDLDHIYGELSNSSGKDPFDYVSFKNSPKQCLIVATDAESGKPVYFDKSELQQDEYGCISASCNMPVINKPYFYKGRTYYDGGISDPLPVDKLTEAGCDRIIVILTLPKNHMRSGNKEADNLKKIKEPAMKQAVSNSAKIYNSELSRCYELEQEGKLLFIAPDDYIRMRPLSKKRKEIIDLYNLGYSKGAQIETFINQ